MVAECSSELGGGGVFRGGSRIRIFGKGGGGLGVGDKLAVRSFTCVPLGGLKACPLGTFEILDAFSCNLVHVLSKS